MYRLSYTYRYALWRAYDMKCFYCKRPVDFLNVEIDHVIPQSLAASPGALPKIEQEYEITENFPGFSINGLTNLVPSDGAYCNVHKGNMLLPKAATLFYLSLVQRNLPKVEKELARLARSVQKGKVFGEMSVALESGAIVGSEILEFLQNFELKCIKDEPLVITFGLAVDETQEMRGVPSEAEIPYPVFCDLLETELDDFLRNATSYSFHYAEVSSRTGETLSVRLVFPELDFEDLDKVPLSEIDEFMPWWEILEVTSFYKVYGQTYQDAYNR